MRKLFFVCMMLVFTSWTGQVNAQVSVSVNVGIQPKWGPVGHSYVQYYYLPEIDSYYDVGNRKFVYYKGKKWVSKKNLPKHFRHLNLYHTHKVVVNQSYPWRNHMHVKNKYKGRGNSHKHHIYKENKDRYKKGNHKKYKNRRHDWDD